MKSIYMETYEIIGENAVAAADYINEQEIRMIAGGAGNAYFSEDYRHNMKRFKEEAAKLFSVAYREMF